MGAFNLSFFPFIFLSFLLHLVVLYFISFFIFYKVGEVRITSTSSKILLQVYSDKIKKKDESKEKLTKNFLKEKRKKSYKHSKFIKIKKASYSKENFIVRKESFLPYWKVDVLPKLIKYERPVYPDFARQNNIEGEVVLRVFIGDDGRVKDVKVIKNEGYEGFKKEAILSIKRAVFSPAMYLGKPVPIWMDVHIKFRLVE